MGEIEHEYLIVGAGPGGLQLGYFMARNGFDYVILEATGEAGSFFRTFPRHRRLISINKVHTGRWDPAVQFRWDWNSLLSDEPLLFKSHSREYFPDANAMVDYLGSFAAHHELNIRYHHRVVEISRRGGEFVVKAGSQTFVAHHVIVATGLSEPYVPPVAGIERAESYATFDPDPTRFTNRKILIVGKGNSGFETAESLIPYAAQIHIVSPSNLKFAWNSHHVGHLRAININLIDTDHLKGQNATIWGEIQTIEPYRGQYRVRISHSDSGSRIFTHYYDDVLCCTGFRMSRGLFHSSCDPSTVLNERLPRLTEEWESTNAENLFFVGTLMQSRDYKKSSSAFIHGFRYNAEALCHMLSLRRAGSWPSRALGRSAECLTNAIAERINTASSLWHQFNFFGDVIDLSASEAKYYPDVPVDFAVASSHFRFARALLVTFTHDAPAEPARRQQFSPEPALHPRVRLIEHGQVVSEHHVLEDLEAEWFEESLYLQPLEGYLAAAVTPSPARPRAPVRARAASGRTPASPRTARPNGGAPRLPGVDRGSPRADPLSPPPRSPE